MDVIDIDHREQVKDGGSEAPNPGERRSGSDRRRKARGLSIERRRDHAVGDVTTAVDGALEYTTPWQLPASGQG